MAYIGQMPYMLTEAEQERFGLSEVETLTNQSNDRIVLMIPENGLAAGDRILSRRNPYYDPDKQPGSAYDNRPSTYAFTDDYGMGRILRAAEHRQSEEKQQISDDIGVLDILGMSLSTVGITSSATEVAQGAIARVGANYESVLNDKKKQAQARLELAEEILDLMKERGHQLTGERRNAIMQAAGSLALGARQDLTGRDYDLVMQLRKNQDRQRELREELKAGQNVRKEISKAAEGHSAIAENEDDFYRQAVKIKTKPGSLAIRNGEYHKYEDGSWQLVVRGLTEWESRYSEMFPPITRLQYEKKRDIQKNTAKVILRHSLGLLVLEDTVDASMIGGDYTTLGIKLRDMLFRTEEKLLQGDASATEDAETFRFLLRYRAMPGEDPPEQWYGTLPERAEEFMPRITPVGDEDLFTTIYSRG